MIDSSVTIFGKSCDYTVLEVLRLELEVPPTLFSYKIG